MTELQTNADLLKALEESSSRSPSFEQLNEQRLSFVIGALPDNNGMTRDQVQDVLDRHEGRKTVAG